MTYSHRFKKAELFNITAQMSGEPWREPDRERGSDSWLEYVWYGPAGEDGDTASELTWSRNTDLFGFSDYQHVGGLLDVYDPDFPYLKTSVFFTGNALRAALKLFDMSFPVKQDLALFAADYGQAVLAHYGGEENAVESLPT